MLFVRRAIIVTHERSIGTLLVSGKIARALLGTCESVVRDLVQHIGCNIQHASLLFSKIVSLITVFLFCWVGNRQYYIVGGFAIHEHITAWSTSYMCTNITVNVKNVKYTSQNPKKLFCFLKCRLVGSQAI